ncbi:MAG: ATP-dependent Clp protease adaptor ClpS [Dehalococcoidia bacterium]|nr:ATP-dependent Clp protease adaptor ClpS [Dehalococcoidia bacterium]
MDAATKPGIEIHEDTDQEYEPLYHLILLDDQYHSYNYVVLMLGAVFGYSVEKAFAIACVVDSTGQAVVMTGSHDEVRSKQDQIHSFGPDPMLTECKGSMSAIIEPAA